MSTAELGDRAQAWLDLLREARKIQKDAKADEELAKANLLDLLGEAEEGAVDGGVVCTNKTTVRTSVNLDVLKTRFPEAYASCLRETPVTTFRVV